jgi:hypothetical protein
MKIPVLFCTIIITAVASSVFAQTPAPTPHQLVFEELSSTSLSMTYDNVNLGTFTASPSDTWNFNLPPTVLLNEPVFGWFEPGTTTLANFLLTANGAGPITITSDSSLRTDTLFQPNGGTFADFAIDLGDLQHVSLTFNDDGDVPGTPDSGTTLGLMSLSLLALFGMARLRTAQNS